MATSSWQNWHQAEETWLQKCPSQAVGQGKDSVRSEPSQAVGGGVGGAGWLNSKVQRHIALVSVARPGCGGCYQGPGSFSPQGTTPT